MKVARTVRVISGERRGSSRPLLVETSSGPQIVKLRGVPQGTGPLVAEIIVAEFAEAIGLSVPARCLVELDAGAVVPDGDDELDDVMRESGGLNLGFNFLDPATDLAARDVASISSDDQAAILWLDRFVMNPDRTASNPNLMRSRDRLWLIDHGAALGFQYNWPAVTEDAAARPPLEHEPHLFAATVSPNELAEWDGILAARVTRDVLEAAVAQVPDEFLLPLLADDRTGGALLRRRAAYAAFLWKRLKTPRGFLAAVTPVRTLGRRGAL
ncbi:MAG: HipA family kinase, partial [Gemmatimonadaceae bacterium]